MPRKPSTHIDSREACGKRLREARERAGLSQRQLAFDGCSPAYISRVESGQRIPSLQLLVELAERLGTTPEWLARGEGLDHRVLLELNGTLIDSTMRSATAQNGYGGLRLADLDAEERTYLEMTLRHRAQEISGEVAVALVGLRREQEELAARQAEERRELEDRQAAELAAVGREGRSHAA